MKLFIRYLKKRLPVIVMTAAFVTVFVICFKLYHFPVEALFYPVLLCIALAVILLLFDFSKVKKQHELLLNIKSINDAMTGVFPKIDGIIDEDYRQIIELLWNEHNLYSIETGRRYSDMVDYYTVWVHQIKTPIASMRLRLQNEDTALARSLLSDLNRIEQYVEMVLTFLRLDSETNDYVFKEYDLDEIIKASLKKFSSEFIGRKLSLTYEPIRTLVITDEKWLEFVIEQILSNALKYTVSGGISISLKGDRILCISDTGIGILPEDLPRIFENGYTGYNGRIDKRASGIGLYLCKRICDNLGHTISISSTVDKGTTVELNLSHARVEFE